MIFDTDILIYADRGMENAKEIILTAEERAISAVTYMEYVPFCRNKSELQVFERLLKSLRFKIYDIDADISMSARSMVRQYALSNSVEMGDALIAATSIKYSEPICTGNVKHFQCIPGVELIVLTPDL